MKGDIIFMGLNIWIEILLIIVFMFMLIGIIDVLSGYRVGFLHLLGVR
jgi:hypothetical protein